MEIIKTAANRVNQWNTKIIPPFILLLCTSLFPNMLRADEGNPSKWAEKLDRVMLKDRHVFVRNTGQWDDQIRYRALSGHSSVFFYDQSMVFSMRRIKTPVDSISLTEEGKMPHQMAEMEFLAYEWSFIGSNAQCKPIAESKVESDYTYFRNGSSKAQRDEKFRTLIYPDIYPKTDFVVYTTDEGQFKYDVKLKPGADPAKVKFGLKGVKRIEIAKNGDLVLHTDWGEFHEKAPYTYQLIDGVEQEVSSAYLLYNDSTIGFQVGHYDPQHELVIDPIQVDWSTYFYGEGKSINRTYTYAYTWVYDVDIDEDDHVYITGVTNDSFVSNVNSYDTTFSGGYWDAFVCKMSPDGKEILKFTYIGGSGWEYAFNIAVNKNQEPVIAGFTYSSAGFPITKGAFDTVPNGTWYKGFITKFNKDLDSLIFSTYFGGQYYNIIYEMELDENDDLYVVGGTTSDDFPVTTNAWQKNYGGGGNNWGWYNGGDGFLSKLSADGTKLLYSTYIGGDGFDRVYDMHLDTSGEVYLCGLTTSTNFTTTAGSRFTFKSAANIQGEDGFMMKFGKNLNNLIYSNIMGGSQDDRFESIFVNENGEAYLGGYSTSSDFPVTFRAYQKQNNGGADHVVVKVRKEGVSLLYSTYLGGSGNDYYSPYGWFQSNIKLASNTKDEAIICGISNSFNYPTTSDAFQRNNGLNTTYWNPSLVIAKLDMYGEKLVYGTYYGGNGYDYPSAVLVKRTSCVSNIVVGGFTTSADYPVTNNAYRTKASSNNAWYNGFVSKFRDTLKTEPIDLGPDQLKCDLVGIVLDAGNQGSDTRWNTGRTSRTLAVEEPGTYWVEATYGCDTVRDTVQVFLEYSPTVPILGSDTTFCDNFPAVTLDAKNDTIDASYLWNTTDTTQQIQPTDTGTYWVRISTKNCGSKTDTLKFHLLKTPLIKQLKDSVFCDTVLWKPMIGLQNNRENYLWSTNDSTNTITIVDTGQYMAKISNICGVDSLEFHVSMLNSPIAILPSDSVFCDQVQWSFESGDLENDEEYQWLDLSRNLSLINRSNSLDIDSSGLFVLEITNRCGSSSDTVEVGILSTPELNLGKDSIYCDQVDVTLKGGNAFNEELYIWQDNSTKPDFRVRNEGLYFLTVNNRCGTAFDSIRFIEKRSPVVDLPDDSVFCENVNWQLNASFPDAEATYLWNTSATTPDILVNQPGMYKVVLSNRCGITSDSVHVSLLKKPVAVIPEDEKVFCDVVTPFTLSSERDASNEETIRWLDGFAADQKEIRSPGWYGFTLENQCGASTDSFLVRVSNSPVVNLGPDTILCGNFKLKLDAGNPGMQFLWFPNGETSQSIEASKQTTYNVTVTNADGCEGTDDFTIGSNCVSHVNIPEAFSPNGDGLNEVFRPVLINYEQFEMKIYNRWGELLFESSDPSMGWDGTYLGNALDAGAYTYVIRFITTEDARFRTFSGIVFLMK